MMDSAMLRRWLGSRAEEPLQSAGAGGAAPVVFAGDERLVKNEAGDEPLKNVRCCAMAVATDMAVRGGPL